MKLGFIGVGNMGGSILKGYCEGKKTEETSIYAYDIATEKMKKLEKLYSIKPCNSIEEVVKNSQIIFLGIKPNLYEKVLLEVAKSYSEEKVIVSMAAGISISFIEKYLSKKSMIVRIMPNTAAQVGESMTALVKNENVNEKSLEGVKDVLNTIGKAAEVSEELIHCVIGVSGSSPAYTYMYIEALANSAVKNGMEERQAIEFAAQSVLGAAKMILETGENPLKLRENVCSPGGTTIEAVNKLKENGFEEKIEEGFNAAVKKSKRMGK